MSRKAVLGKREAPSVQTGDTNFLKQLGAGHFHSFSFQSRAAEKQQAKGTAGSGKDKGTSLPLPPTAAANEALLRQTQVLTL